MFYTIRNDALTIRVATAGAQLMSILGADSTQYLWQGDPRYWPDRSLTIFPYVARLTQGSYRYRGKLYHMPIHGFGLGGHPGINVPLEKGLAFEDYCLEPWTSLPSRQDLVEDLEKQPDLIRLEPKNVYKTTWSLETF